MKRLWILLLVLVMLAVPVSAQGYYVADHSGLLDTFDAQELEQLYSQYSDEYGFTPILVTTDSFEGMDADQYAGWYYDQQAYPYDGILLLVSLEEGQWYILTNGACYQQIDNWEAQQIGDILVEYLRDGEYYEAFSMFPELAAEAYCTSESEYGGVDAPVGARNYGKTILICMIVGMAIGGIAVGIMSLRMRTVRQQSGASDYIRPGSLQLTQSRDIFLYSHVSRSPKPKSNSSGGGGGGGSRGGAGGRI